MSDKPIKILYLITSLGGGPGTTLINTANFMARRGFDVTICEWARRDEGFTNSLESNIHRVWVRRLNKWDPTIWLRMMRLIFRVRPQILQGVDFTSNIFSVVCGRLSGVKAVVVSMHGLVDAFVPWKAWLQRRLFTLVRKVHCGSHAAAEKVKVTLGLTDESIRVIYNGIDVKSFTRNAEPVVGDRIIGCVANFYSPIKGQNYLIEALPQILAVFPDVKLWLVGDGILRGSYEEQVRSLGIEDRVVFCGHQTDTAKYFALFDVFVLPSLSEGFGIAIIEAMAGGAPVIASNVGGIPEIIENGYNGILVPPRDPKAISDAVNKVLEDRTLHDCFVERGLITVRNLFDISVVGKEFEKLYLEILSREMD